MEQSEKTNSNEIVLPVEVVEKPITEDELRAMKERAERVRRRVALNLR